MSLWYEIRRRAKSAITPVGCACAVAYFGYHAVEGDRGLHAYTRLQVEIEEAKAVLAETTAERRQLEHRVDLLSSDGLDTDMLEEQAKRVLGLVRPDELIILLPE